MLKKKKPPNVSLDVWLICTIPDAANTVIYVDVSVRIRAVHAKSYLGFESFFASPSNANDGLLEKYCLALGRYLEPL